MQNIFDSLNSEIVEMCNSGIFGFFVKFEMSDLDDS